MKPLRNIALGPADHFIMFQFDPKTGAPVQAISNPERSTFELLTVLLSAALGMVAQLQQEHPIWSPHHDTGKNQQLVTDPTVNPVDGGSGGRG